jgi:hypothetical protein
MEMAKPTAPASSTPVDLRAYHPLARLRRIIRAYVTIEGTLSALIMIGLWFWLSLAIDFGVHYFLGIDLLQDAAPVRYVLLVLVSAGVLAALVFFVFRRIFREFRAASLALVLEKRYPELLGDRLITAVELADLKKAAALGYSTDMIKKTMKEAQERVNTVPVRTVFNWHRLRMMFWLFLGVTALVMLIAYPLCVLFSLIGGRPGEAAWRMLAINGLILLNIVFVFTAPFLLSTQRLRPFRVHLMTLAVLCAAVAGVGFFYALKSANAMKLNDYAWKFYHAADITMERNLLFKDTRWPKDDYHVELLDFPVKEKRIEHRKDLMVRAFFCRWIIADAKAPSRWRPLAWADLPKVLPGETVPELPIDQINAYQAALAAGDASTAAGFDERQLEAQDKNSIKVDLVLAAARDPKFLAVYRDHLAFATGDPEVIKAMSQAILNPEEEQPALKPFTEKARKVIEPILALDGKLAARAADPKLGGRLVRQVAAPDRLTLVYTSLELKDGKLVPKSEGREGGEVDLVNLDDRANVYGAKLPKLEDPIKIHVEARIGDLRPRTVERIVDLVMAPKMSAISYQEKAPAYFYHLPPLGPRGDETMDQRRRYLRDLRQVLETRTFERPPDRFPIAIGLGSELSITCKADKRLKEVTLTPQSNFPGSVAKEEATPIKLNLNPDGRSFTVAFATGGKPIRDWLAAPNSGNPVFPLIARSMDFEVTMKDIDNMTSNKVIFVKPEDDKAPGVQLDVDVIRRVKNRYMCTARAEIPFKPESEASDDKGLHKITYTYEYIPLANAVVVSQKAEMAAWLFASSPVNPTIADYIYRREILLRTVSAQKGPTTIKGTVPVKAFDAEMLKQANYKIPKLDELKTLVGRPLPDGYMSPVINRFKFKNDEGPEVFDLERILPELARKDPISGAQPSYEMVINVRVTDSNVLADADRTAENEASLVFKVVPEHELFAEISREEGELARKLDDIIKRLEGAQRNLEASASRAPALNAETAPSEQTRVETIIEIVGKSRELTAEVGSEYGRILREYRVNRFADQLTRGLQDKIVDPIGKVQSEEFPQAEEELNKFHASMKDGVASLASQQAGPTVLKMKLLVDKLKAIRANMGTTLGINEAIVRLKAIIDGQEDAGKRIGKWLQEEYDRLLSIVITNLPTVNVAAGKSEKVTLKLQMPETLLKDPFLRFEVPTNSGLRVTPSEIPLKDNSTDATFEVAAGNTPGNFTIVIVPSQGKPVELKVVVK